MEADGAAVVMTWLWEGMHKAKIADFLPMGKAIAMSSAATYFFDEDNRLTGHWRIQDNLGVFQQLHRNSQHQP